MSVLSGLRPLVLFLGTIALLLAGPMTGLGPASPVPMAGTSPPLSAHLTGLTTLGTLMNATYTVTATGGPATAANGTVVGVYDYRASYTALNRTGILFGSQAVGVLVNGTTSLRFTAPAVVEPVTLAVLITSTYQGVNATQNVTVLVNIVQPFVLRATVVVGGGASVAPFNLTVTLDGAPVGQIGVVGLSAGQTYPVSFRYVDTGMPSGWHTFSVSLAQEHGLVTFPGGAETYTSTFYVAPPPADNTVWYLSGTVAFFGAIVIWTARVGARRRGKSKK